MGRGSVRACLALLALTAPDGLASQEPGSVYGWVRDVERGVPVAGAEVRLQRAGRRVLTDPSGFFALTDLETGRDTLTVRHLGYAERHVVIIVLDARSVRVSVPVTARPIELGGIDVAVMASRRTRQLLGFRRRSDIGSGIFMSEAELEARGGRELGSFLQDLPGVRIRRSGAFDAHVFAFRGQICRPRVWVDGREKHLGAAAQALTELRGSDLEALELYRGSEAPAEFAGPCLTIVAWTRGGTG